MPGAVIDQAPLGAERRCRTRRPLEGTVAEPARRWPAGLDAIAAHDSSFDPRHFLSGARSAYEMIVLAFANGDPRSLKDLLSGEVYDSFEFRDQGSREARAGKPKRGLFRSTRAPSLVGAEARDPRGAVLTMFVSCRRMISVNPRQTGAIVDGNPYKVADITDCLDIRPRHEVLRDPNWKLVGTGSAALTRDALRGSRFGGDRFWACSLGSGGCSCGTSLRDRKKPLASAGPSVTCHTPELELPFQINGGPVCAGRLVRDRRLERGRSSRRLQRVSLQLQADIAGQRTPPGRSEGARAPRRCANPLPDRERPRTVRRTEGKKLSSRSIFFPLRISRLGRRRGVLSTVLLRAHRPTARGRRTRSTRCRFYRPAIQPVRPRPPRRARPACPTRGQVFRKNSAVRKMVALFTNRARDRGWRDLPAAGIEICYLKEQTDLLFSQIQGSARVSLDDGSTPSHQLRCP